MAQSCLIIAPNTVTVPAEMVCTGSLLKVSVGNDGIMHEPEPGGHEVGNDDINGVVPPGHHQHEDTGDSNKPQQPV